MVLKPICNEEDGERYSHVTRACSSFMSDTEGSHFTTFYTNSTNTTDNNSTVFLMISQYFSINGYVAPYDEEPVEITIGADYEIVYVLETKTNLTGL